MTAAPNVGKFYQEMLLTDLPRHGLSTSALHEVRSVRVMARERGFDLSLWLDCEILHLRRWYPDDESFCEILQHLSYVPAERAVTMKQLARAVQLVYELQHASHRWHGRNWLAKVNTDIRTAVTCLGLPPELIDFLQVTILNDGDHTTIAWANDLLPETA